MKIKTALITGATRGIGKATALLFAQRGMNVAFTYKQSDDLAGLLVNEIEKMGLRALAIRCDASSSEDCSRAVGLTVEKLGGLDVLVNNAGISGNELVVDMSDEEWRNMLSVNLDSVFYMTRAAIPHMLNRDCAIVNVSSMWGRTGASCEAHYSAAKAGVIGFTRALAKEMGPSGIRVNAVAPGVIATDMNSHLNDDDMTRLADETPLCRIGQSSEVARAIYFLASEDASFITGQVLGVDGGYVID